MALSGLPRNEIFINAQPSLLQRLYNAIPTPPTTGIAQVGIAVIFSQDASGQINPPSSADIYTNAQGELVDASGHTLPYLNFSPGTNNVMKAGKAYVALSSRAPLNKDNNAWAQNPFLDSSGNYIESQFQLSTAIPNQIGYDSFEFSFENNAGDQANLTSINSFAIPMRMWVPGNTTSNNRSGFRPLSDNADWVETLGSLTPSGENIFRDLGGNFLMAATPTSSTFTWPYAYQWAYLPQDGAYQFVIGKGLANIEKGQPIQFIGDPSANQGLTGQLPIPLEFQKTYYIASYDQTSGIIQLSETTDFTDLIKFTSPAYNISSIKDSNITIDAGLNWGAVYSTGSSALATEVTFTVPEKNPTNLVGGQTYYVYSYDNSTGLLQVSDGPVGSSSFSPVAVDISGTDLSGLSVTNKSQAGVNAPSIAMTPATQQYPESAYPNFDDYVNAFANWLPKLPLATTTQPNPVLTASPYSVSGFFNGAPSVGGDGNYYFHNQGYYNYQIFFDASGDNIVLVPGNLANAGVSTIQGVYSLSRKSLGSGIIQTDSDFLVYNSLTDYYASSPYENLSALAFAADPSGSPKPATTVASLNTGDNNQWGPVFSDFATGFVAGFWRESGSDPSGSNSLDTQKYNNSNYWSYLKSDGKTVNAFNNPINPNFGDIYSDIVGNNANTYTGNYSDRLKTSLSKGNPLVNVGATGSDPSGTTAFDNSLYVSLLDIYELPSEDFFQENPTTTQEVEARFADFTWNGYQDPEQPFPSSLPITSFSSLPSVNNNSDFKVEIDFTAVNASPIIPETQAITAISLTSSDRNFLDSVLPFTGWGKYTFEAGSQDPSGNTPDPSGNSEPSGLIILDKFPLPSQAGTTKYTLKLLSNSKDVYSVDFYLTGDGKSFTSAGADYYPLANSDDIAASVPYADPSGSTMTNTNNTYLKSLSLRPSFSAPNYIPPQIADYNQYFLENGGGGARPFAPLISTPTSSGSGSASQPQQTVFQLAPDYFNEEPEKNDDYIISTAFDSGKPLTFSWLGGPNAVASAGIPSYVLPQSFIPLLQDYTNKVFPLATGVLRIEEASQAQGAPLSMSLPFQADLDGQWAVSMNAKTPLPGQSGRTFTASFSQSLKDASGSTVEIGYAGGAGSKSFKTTFTVKPSQGLSFQSNDQGLTLIASPDSTSSGQWINFEVDNWQPSGNSTFVFYATDASGNLIAGDQKSVGESVSITDATLARIGTVVTDAGELMQKGRASLFLRTGQFLRLAVVSGDGTVVDDLPVSSQVLESGQGQVALIGAEKFAVKASLTNDLDPVTWLSFAQIQQDDPIYYLDAGSRVQIEAAGSCGLINTLRWVPVEVDAVTGERRVGGVAAADTGEFRNALRLNALDFALTGGGQGDKFELTKELAVTKSGYYAPFLETSEGNTFFIGSEASPGGLSYFRLFGNGTFGIEDLPGANLSDFDFNDMVVRMIPL